MYSFKLSKIFLLYVFIFALTSMFAQQKPNIILIMTDDQGWFDTGFNGNGTIMTPNLDELAAKGVILDQFYAASAVCSPTRASVMTGRNPNRMGVPDANSGHLRTEEITIAELLKAMGMESGKKKLKELKAPMPGLVLNVLVKSGDEVAEGQELIVLEAMKMENAIKCPQAGIIDQVLVVNHDKLEKNQLILSFV